MKVLIVGVVVALEVVPRLATACSAPVCWPGAFVPGDGAHVPANVPGLVWRPMGNLANPGAGDPSKVSLVATDAPNTPLALTAHANPDGTFTFTPTSALIAGKQYTLADATVCAASSTLATPSVTFTATAAAPLPAALGTTSAMALGVGPIQLATASGSCSVDATADRVDLTLIAAADAAPWRDLLLFSTWVDGSAWGASGAFNTEPALGASWVGHGADRVFERCSGGDATSSLGVAAGSHTGHLTATLPGTSLSLATADTSFTTSCGAGPSEGPTDPGSAPANHGCSASGGATTPALGALGLVVLARRRRRARR